jgi:hypothetical protein
MYLRAKFSFPLLLDDDHSLGAGAEECAVCASPVMLVHALGSFAPGQRKGPFFFHERYTFA